MNANRDRLLVNVKEASSRNAKLIQNCRRRLKKAGSRSTAEAIEREIETLAVRLDELKAQNKALKRGIVPDGLTSLQAIK
jgi:predicted  nucleic acid-binding Zn-ribbon protein